MGSKEGWNPEAVWMTCVRGNKEVCRTKNWRGWAMKLILEIFWIFFLLSECQYAWAKNTCQNTLGNNYQSTNRHYCILSTETEWDYAPNSTKNKMDLTTLYENNAQTILTQSSYSMGSLFVKAIYREYEYDQSTKSCEWTKLKSSSSSSVNGILGPTIRAIVGDKIFVHYKNNCSRSYSIEPHGLFHSQNVNDLVSPHEETTYTWLVMESSGPESKSFSSRVWMYHGGNENDLHSGLIGPIVIVSADHIATTDQKKFVLPCDVDFEFILGMMSFDETLSW
jgi:manganese oxidase